MSEIAEVAVDSTVVPAREASSSAAFRLPRSLEILLGIVVLMELIIPFVTTTYGIDGGLHLNWIGQFTKLLSQGVWIPRWVPEAFWGFGGATFYFYPPVTYYLAALIHFVTGSSTATFLYQMSGLVATIASFFTARLFLKALRSPRYQMNIGALLFAFAPFRMAELYSRSALSTHVSYAVLPLVWLGVARIFQQRGANRVLNTSFLGAMLALLALVNVPMTMVTGVCALIAIVIERRRFTRRITSDLFLSGLVAIALSAFHYSAAIAAKPYARLEDLKPINMEFLLTDLLHKTGLAAGYHVGLLYVAFVCVAFYYRRSTRKNIPLTPVERSVAVGGLAILALTALLEIPRYSLAVWYNFPPFPIIQFPWRFYAYIVLAGSLLVGVGRSKSMRQAGRAIAWIWVVGAIFPAVLLVGNIHLASHFSRPIEDATEYRPIHAPERQQLASTLAPLKETPPFIASVSSNDRITLVSDTPEAQDYSVALASPTPVTFHRFWWPFWHLTVNDRIQTVGFDNIGRATAVLPAGSYQAQWRLDVAPIERVGRWISLVCVIGLLVINTSILIRQGSRA